MNTSKPISTISYNSENFLKSVLDKWLSLHIISDYIYIYHYAEEDEKKDHFHVFLFPNTKVDTISLQEQLREIDFNNPKPLGCINFVSSNPDDFILYTQHFVPYLVSKNEMREFIYQKSDFHFPDQDNFDVLYRHAFYQSDWAKDSAIRQKLKDGVPACDIILSGILPIQMSSSLLALANLEEKKKLQRSYHANHENNEFIQDIDK